MVVGGWSGLMASSCMSGHLSVRVSFPEQISETHEAISFILHSRCRCAFWGL